MAWYFKEMQQTGTIIAREPNGVEHVVKVDDMNSTSGINLLNAMIRDLCDDKGSHVSSNPALEEVETEFHQCSGLLDDAHRTIEQLEKQRDELLAALERFAYYPGAICQADYDIARSTIASVRGAA